MRTIDADKLIEELKYGKEYFNKSMIERCADQPYHDVALSMRVANTAFDMFQQLVEISASDHDVTDRGLK